MSREFPSNVVLDPVSGVVEPERVDDASATGAAESQKKRRLDDGSAVSEADYKARLKRLLKLAPADVVIDILATM